MTTYERVMTLDYDWVDKPDDPNLHEKIMSELHNVGYSVISKYRWSTVEWKEFGYQTVIDTTSYQEILIDGSVAFTLQYLSEAEKAVEGLESNGYTASSRNVTTTKEFDKWICPQGSYVYTEVDGIDATTQFNTSPPSWVYDDNLSMTIKLADNNDGYCLTFTISYTADSIQGKKQVEKQVVDRPANDMRMVIGVVTEIIALFGQMDEPIIDCISCIKSETTAKCEPATIEKVMG